MIQPCKPSPKPQKTLNYFSFIVDVWVVKHMLSEPNEPQSKRCNILTNTSSFCCQFKHWWFLCKNPISKMLKNKQNNKEFNFSHLPHIPLWPLKTLKSNYLPVLAIISMIRVKVSHRGTLVPCEMKQHLIRVIDFNILGSKYTADTR